MGVLSLPGFRSLIWKHLTHSCEPTRAKHSVLPDSTTPNRDEPTHTALFYWNSTCASRLQIWRLFLSQLFLYFQMLNVKLGAMGVKLSPQTQACKIHCLLYLYHLTWALCPHLLILRIALSVLTTTSTLPYNIKVLSSPAQYKHTLVSRQWWFLTVSGLFASLSGMLYLPRPGIPVWGALPTSFHHHG